MLIRPAIAVLQHARPQLSVLGLLLSLNLLSYFGILPPYHSLTKIIENLFREHGLPLVAACSFVENIVGINAYFPGSIAILAGMALTAGDPIRALETYFAIVIPAALANILSYYLGRRLSRDSNNSPDGLKNPSNRKTWGLFILTYWHPHLAAMTSFAAGVRLLPLRSFLPLFAVCSTFWSIFWGLIVYHFGTLIKGRGDLIAIVYVYFIVWACWDIYKGIQKDRSQTELRVEPKMQNDFFSGRDKADPPL